MGVQTFCFTGSATGICPETQAVPHYYVCDTEAEIPSIGLAHGDLAFTRDSSRLWVFGGTWRRVILAGEGELP